MKTTEPNSGSRSGQPLGFAALPGPAASSRDYAGNRCDGRQRHMACRRERRGADWGTWTMNNFTASQTHSSLRPALPRRPGFKGRIGTVTRPDPPRPFGQCVGIGHAGGNRLRGRGEWLPNKPPSRRARCRAAAGNSRCVRGDMAGVAGCYSAAASLACLLSAARFDSSNLARWNPSGVTKPPETLRASSTVTGSATRMPNAIRRACVAVRNASFFATSS